MSKAVEITGTDTIVLTHQGVVVGHIKIRQNNYNSIEFVGQAVNLRTPDFSTMTFHSFACSGSINADNVIDIASADYFNDAMAKVSK